MGQDGAKQHAPPSPPREVARFTIILLDDGKLALEYPGDPLVAFGLLASALVKLPEAIKAQGRLITPPGAFRP